IDAVMARFRPRLVEIAERCLLLVGIRQRSAGKTKRHRQALVVEISARLRPPKTPPDSPVSRPIRTPQDSGIGEVRTSEGATKAGRINERGVARVLPVAKPLL